MMHIYAGDSNDHIPAENMRIGDNLTLVVTLEEQPIFGMTVFDCVVRDGLGWSDQLLYNDEGYIGTSILDISWQPSAAAPRTPSMSRQTTNACLT